MRGRRRGLFADVAGVLTAVARGTAVPAHLRGRGWQLFAVVVAVLIEVAGAVARFVNVRGRRLVEGTVARFENVRGRARKIEVAGPAARFEKVRGRARKIEVAGPAARSEKVRGRRLIAGPVAVLTGVALGLVVPAPADAPDTQVTNQDFGLGGPTQVADPVGMPIRIAVSWWAVEHDEPVAGQEPVLNWAAYDKTINDAHAAGMKILLLMTYSPPWASGDHGSKDGLDHWFPTPEWTDEWVDFVGKVADRYAGKVEAFEIWNEPNHAEFGNYGSGSDGERLQTYWELVRKSKARILDSGCPTCLVVAGGSAAGTRPENQPKVPRSEPNPNSPAVWLQWAYDHGYGDSFDAVAHHPYPNWTINQGPSQRSCGRPDRSQFGPPYQEGKPYQQQCGQLAALRAVLVDHGHGHKKIWGTEWGYPTESFSNEHPSLDAIRDFDAEGIHMWRELDYVGPLFLYQFQDLPCAAGNRDPECHYGIVTQDGTPKEPRYSELLKKVNDEMPSSLASGETLRRWSALRSPNRRFTLWLQGDGNLVLYDSWTSKTLWGINKQNGRRLVSHSNGNLVLYRGNDPKHLITVWQSGTSGVGPTTLHLQNDGNLVLYSNTTNTPIWSTNTFIQN
ncbi:hypothetical protein AB0M02_03365 [Actinoplanes sp. NPDC051861]|uniref:hypothetical protein n=1 Tax=Actinoplanes sp. NPDC051861 TaxID=3155170 RepID=UPI003449E937